MPRLTNLDIGGTRVGDAGAAELAKSSRSKFLDVEQTKITNQGLAELKTLEKLHLLYVQDARRHAKGRLLG